MRLLVTSPLGQAGATYRGHELHYARLLHAGDAPPLFDVTDAHGQSLGLLGAQLGATAGSFLHLIDRTTERADETGRGGHLEAEMPPLQAVAVRIDGARTAPVPAAGHPGTSSLTAHW